MSTKIYNGYRISKPTTLKSILKWCKQSKKIACKELNKKAKNDYIELATDILDKSFYYNKDQLNHYLKQKYLIDDLKYGLAPFTMLEIAEKYEKKEERIFSKYDYKVEICLLNAEKYLLVIGNNKFNLFPHYDDHDNIVPGLLRNVEYYGYWNNTDRPDNISEEEWNLRGELWDIALPTGIPSKDGLAYTIIDSTDINFFFKKQSYKSHITYEDRIKINTNIILNTIFNEKCKHKLSSASESDNLHNNNYYSFLKQSESNGLTERIEKMLKRKLPKSYDNILNNIEFKIINNRYVIKEN